MEAKYSDPVINLCIDTVLHKRQALVFCNTKRGAESQAEKTSGKLPLSLKQKERCLELSENILAVLETPTKQCQRLAACIRGGSAFHHAGLPAKQRDIIETSFRENELFIICSTPTLAMGLDMPAFRSIIRDIKRFSVGRGWGMSYIPVLEYEQMAGRAGRPGHETWGEAFLVATDAAEAQELRERYLEGSAEEIYSKLAVEPVLRTYLLSLIASGFIRDTKGMYEFFERTFYAKQYADMTKIHLLLDKMLLLLQEWKFVAKTNSPSSSHSSSKTDALQESGFFSANELLKKDDENVSLRATLVGSRVAELYIDPYTAQFLLSNLEKTKNLSNEGLLHLLSNTLEIRPLLTPRAKEFEKIDEWLLLHDSKLIVPQPTEYSYEYDEYLASIKTTMFLLDWIDEKTEDMILEEYGVRPGELRAKTDIADWLLYSCEELCKISSMLHHEASLSRMRVRLQYGVKEELLALMKFKGIGKVRARVLYRNNIKSVSAIKECEISTLVSLIGPALTKSLKEQVGISVDVAIPKNKRKGQKNLADWSKK